MSDSIEADFAGGITIAPQRAYVYLETLRLIDRQLQLLERVLERDGK